MPRLLRSIVFFLLLLGPAESQALSIIRDAEIEKTLRDYSDPIFKAAGLNPESVNIAVVNDKTLNAFVAGGMNLFINTGLITECKTPSMLIGVIAHETGHMAGGHVIRREEEMKSASMEALLGSVLGVAVAVAGLPDVGRAVMVASPHIAGRNLLRFTREQESAADQAAIRFMNKTGVPVKGLLDIMELLQRKETLSFSGGEQYLLSHPLTKSRIAHVHSYVTGDEAENPRQLISHKRVTAKLYAFLNTPSATFQLYPDSDTSPAARYARAIARYRIPETENALADMDSLLADYPQDPFFNEMKAQILFESGSVAASIPYYRKAEKLYPASALIKSELAAAIIEKNRDSPSQAELKESIDFLNQATEIERGEPSFFRLLAVAYEKSGNHGMKYLSLAEEAAISGRKDEAKNSAMLAARLLKEGSAGRLRAEDIIKAAERSDAKL